MSQQKEQAQLIEKIGIGLEERLKLSPLASRIYSLLILSSYDGLTFEEVREVIQASKSSTSVNINVLIQLGYITYYTKPGNRKRYFKLAKYSSLVSLESYCDIIDKEMDMVNRINAYNKKYYPQKFNNEESLGQIFQDYLVEKQELVARTIAKMKSFQITDN